MRRLVIRAWALVVAGSLAVALASAVWAYFGGEGSGSVDIALGVPTESCEEPTAAADAQSLAHDDPAAAAVDFDGCLFDFHFGIPAGVPGAPGADGADGAPGEQGPPGQQGIQGPPGADGAQGPAGADGQSVVAEPSSDCNGTGRPGSRFSSVSGVTWACDGAQGPQGTQGPKGDTGETGAQGPQGPQGPAGADGAAGVSGYVIATGSTNCGANTNVCPLTVNCPGSKKPLTWAYTWGDTDNVSSRTLHSVVISETGVTVTLRRAGTTATGDDGNPFGVQVVCASV